MPPDYEQAAAVIIRRLLDSVLTGGHDPEVIVAAVTYLRQHDVVPAN